MGPDGPQTGNITLEVLQKQNRLKKRSVAAMRCPILALGRQTLRTCVFGVLRNSRFRCGPSQKVLEGVQMRAEKGKKTAKHACGVEKTETWSL